MPHATVKIYEGAPHGVFLTHAERLNKDLMEFAASVVGRPTYQILTRSLGFEIKLVARLHTERCVPRVHVALRERAARRTRRVRVREHLRTQSVVARLATPGLREGQEEALIAGEAVENGRLVSLEGELVGGVGHFEAAEIADVLAHRELAVHAGAFERAIGWRTARRASASLRRIARWSRTSTSCAPCPSHRTRGPGRRSRDRSHGR